MQMLHALGGQVRTLNFLALRSLLFLLRHLVYPQTDKATTLIDKYELKRMTLNYEPQQPITW